MNNGIFGLLSGNGHWLGTSAILAALLLFLRTYRDSLSFWWTDLRYRLPFVGLIDRLANNPAPAAEPGWLTGERRLCSDYFKHVQAIDRWTFENYLTYLKKAFDTGRKPLALGMWIFLAVMTLAEGLGFAYLLGAQVAADGSENIRIVLMLAFVLLMSGILVVLTHMSGHQLYRTQSLKNCFRRFRARGAGGYLYSSLVPLRDDQKADDQDFSETQCAARVASQIGETGSYKLVGFTVLLIILIAAGSTYLRFAHFQSLRNQTTVEATADPFANGGPSDAAGALPDGVTQPQRIADAKARTDISNAETDEAATAFILLGIIFLATQFLGIAASYKWCFAGLESAVAYEATHGHPNYESYFAPYRRRIDLAQARLQQLQQEFDDCREHEGKRTRNFIEYVRERQASNPSDAFSGNPGSSAISGGMAVIERALERLRATRLQSEKVAILAGLSDADRAAVQSRLRQMQGGGAARIEEDFKGLI